MLVSDRLTKAHSLKALFREIGTGLFVNDESVNYGKEEVANYRLREKRHFLFSRGLAEAGIGYPP